MVGTKRVQIILLVVLLLTASVVSEDACKCKRKEWDFNTWCLAKVAGGGAASVAVAPYALAVAGFTSAGVAAGSAAAWMMSLFGGTVPAWIAALQSAGAAGVGAGGGATLAAVGGGATLLAAEKLGCVKTVCCRPNNDPDCHCDSAPT